MAQRGRPPKGIERKYVPHGVRLTPEVSDAVCRYALKHHVSVYKLLGDVIARVFAHNVRLSSSAIGYREVTSLTVVAARHSSGVSSAGLV